MARTTKAAKVAKRAVLALATLALIAVVGVVGFLSVGQMGPGAAAEAALEGSEKVEVTWLDQRTVVFSPANKPKNQRGLVFYQGAKVEATAYAPLLAALAEEGWTCVTADAPLNFAMTDADAAARLIPRINGVSRWYVGGHSFGGFVSAQYAAAHTDQVEGLVLLGSYANADISDSGLNVITIHGTNDLVCSQEKFEADLPNLPASAHVLQLQGGNHAQFGDYGPQQSDGQATLSAEEQVAQTAAFINASAA